MIFSLFEIWLIFLINVNSFLVCVQCYRKKWTNHVNWIQSRRECAKLLELWKIEKEYTLDLVQLWYEELISMSFQCLWDICNWFFFVLFKYTQNNNVKLFLNSKNVGCKWRHIFLTIKKNGVFWNRKNFFSIDLWPFHFIKNHLKIFFETFLRLL